jgi:hypothetical protein
LQPSFEIGPGTTFKKSRLLSARNRERLVESALTALNSPPRAQFNLARKR